MKLDKVELKGYNNINCEVFINDDGSIMVADISGNYRHGSEGNPDGMYLYSVIVSHYFVLEPVSVILDIRRLDYQWGNTLLKSLNFFLETGRDDEERARIIIIVASVENKTAVSELLNMAKEGNRILCDTYEEAVNLAKAHVQEFLK